MLPLYLTTFCGRASSTTARARYSLHIGLTTGWPGIAVLYVHRYFHSRAVKSSPYVCVTLWSESKPSSTQRAFAFAAISSFGRRDVAGALECTINQSDADLIEGRDSPRCSRQRVSSWMTQRLAWRLEDRFMMTSSG